MTVSVRRALALSFLERYALIILGLGSNMVLARLLTPEQIGIYSVSLAVIGVAQVLRDFGIGTFLIQHRNPDEEHIRSAFGLALLIGTTLFLLAFFAAPAVSRFYAAPPLTQTIRISAFNFLILPFCTISLALLRRDMRFDRLIVVTLASTALSTATTITAAYQGHGPNSMAIGSLVGNLATGLGAYIARSEHKFVAPGFSKWRELVQFGHQSSLVGIVTSISMDANDLVVGKILGFHPVAILSRAQGLMNLFHRDVMAAVRNVALPSYAATKRNGDDLEGAYRRSLTNLTAVAWPFYGLVSLYALEILRLLFGPQWDEARDLVPIFCAAGAIAALSSLIPTYMVANGGISALTRTELLLQPLRLALILGAAAQFRTTMACAIAYLLSAIVAVPVFHAAQPAPKRLRHLAQAAVRSGVITLICLAPAAIHTWYVGFQRTEPVAIWQVCVTTGVCVVAWMGSLIALRHPISTETLFRRVTSLIWRRAP